MEKNSDTKRESLAALSWFTRSTLRFTPLLIELAVLAAVVRLIGLVEPFVFQTLIDRILPFQREASLTLVLAVLTGSNLFSAVLSALSGLLSAQMANRLARDMGSRIFRHALGLPTLSLQRFQVGQLLARIGEIDTVRGFLTGTVLDLILDLLFAVIYIAALYTLSPLLTLLLTVILPLQMISFGLFGPFIRRRMQRSFLAIAAHQSRLVEAFSDPVTVKALSAEGIHAARVTETLTQTLFSNWLVTRIHVASEALGHVLRGMSVVLVIYFGADLVFKGQLTFGQLVAFHLLSQNVAGPIMSLSTIWEKWQGLRIARLRLGDLLNRPAEGDARLPILMATGRPSLEARELSFSYVSGQAVFANVNLVFPTGKATIITGDSGCGKSTLAKVLCGLYPPEHGEVIFEKQNIARHDPASVRRRIAYVAQEPILFNGSILDNLRMSSPSASDAAIEEALKASAASDFVRQMPDGLATEVGERGVFLSGGQRQRIAIARSLLTGADILILDEPTSSLDEDTAAAIMATLSQLALERTVIIITHRLDLMKCKVNVINLNALRGSSHG